MADIVISMESASHPQIVSKIQSLLTAKGVPVKVDGIFGPKTDAAVREYQSNNGLKVDGIVGNATIDSLMGTAPAKYTPPKRGKVIKLTLEDVLHRAKGCINAPVKYHLEYPNGGTDPDSPMPCDEHTGFLDCSGFNAWVHGFDRYQPGVFRYWDGYINTDSKIAEAEKDGLWFTIHEAPEVGDMVVGETFRRLTGQRKIGHEGTIVDISEWATRGLAGIQVVHCSPGNYAYTKGDSAIWKTSGSVWAQYRKYRFLRFNRDHAMMLHADKSIVPA